MRKACVCFLVGVRPNFMKVAPVHHALREIAPHVDRVLIHTGQHYDADMSEVFLDELELPQPDHFLGVGSGTPAEQTAAALVGIERAIVGRRPDLLVVAGDVNSTLAGALAAVKVDIPVAHLESGLRSFDRGMPEEHNRRLVDHVSSLLLAHSVDAVENLSREGIVNDVHLVGNTMIDSVLRHLPEARQRKPWTDLGLDEGTYALVTLHRPALVDVPALLPRLVMSLVGLAAAMPVVFPVHPRTRERLRAGRLESQLMTGGVRLTPPQPYRTFLGLVSASRLVVTDSGGVQEETSALGIPCFTLRDTTERPVTVTLGTNTVLGSNPERIREIPEMLAAGRSTTTSIPLWDGEAGRRAAEVVASFVASPGRAR